MFHHLFPKTAFWVPVPPGRSDCHSYFGFIPGSVTGDHLLAFVRQELGSLTQPWHGRSMARLER